MLKHILNKHATKEERKDKFKYYPVSTENDYSNKIYDKREFNMCKIPLPTIEKIEELKKRGLLKSVSTRGRHTNQPKKKEIVWDLSYSITASLKIFNICLQESAKRV